MSETISFNLDASGIPYNVREGYPTFSFSYDGNTAEEEIVLHKQYMHAFFTLSMPPPVIFNDTVIPFAARPMPGTVGLLTNQLDFSPLKKDLPQDPWNLWDNSRKNEYMICKIQYKTADFPDDDTDPEDPETFLEFSFDTTADMLKLPVSRTNFGSVGTQTGQEQNASQINVDNEIPSTIIIPTTTYTANWKFALNPSFSLFRSLIGRVNGATDPLFFDAPAGTILFVGFSGKRSFLWGGQEVTVTPWDLNFKFVGKHIEIGDRVYGWNQVFRPSTGQWETVLKADGSTLYRTTSTFSQMFRAAGL